VPLTPLGWDAPQTPTPGWLSAESDVQREQTVAACHKESDAITWRVLLEPLVEPFGHAKLVGA
jgi:hypothetical protein